MVQTVISKLLFNDELMQISEKGNYCYSVTVYIFHYTNEWCTLVYWTAYLPGYIFLPKTKHSCM